MAADPPFWLTTPLESMTRVQWESLCDHCGRCCLFKLEDEDSGALFYTDVVCRLMDPATCHCTAYTTRTELVPDCHEMTPEKAYTFGWMPDTCAYRLLAEGHDLPWWHPLVSGDPDSVHRAGISVRGRVVSETGVRPDELEDHIIEWVAPARITGLDVD